VRQDKGASLRERLRKGVSNFEFDALIQGVGSPDVAGETPALRSEPTPAPTPVSVGNVGSEREGLRAALNTLGDRLLHESGKLAAALTLRDPTEAGYYLARINQVLELLRAVDPQGDIARRLRTTASPPIGSRWPPTAWSVYEFAESPISGLLPPNADERFCSALIEAAIASPDAPSESAAPATG